MSPVSAPGGDNRLALGAGLSCYLIWGFVPLIFQAIGALGVGPWEILAHRIVWSIPTAALFVWLARQGPQAMAVLRQPRTLAWLFLSSLLIATNWVVFIWAVTSGRLLESSLGYYINPLVSMAAGALLFRERIDRIGMAAIALALVGVTVQAIALGHLPWVSLVLAFSFGGYGVVRKQVAADAQTGFLVETLLVGLVAVGYIAWQAGQPGASHFSDPVTAAWLIACGPITAIPLVLFSWAARRVPLSVMGFMQFLSPTISFVIGLSQGEAFTPLRALSFAFIWGGAAVFLYGAWRRSRSVIVAQKIEAAAE
ncbi:MAG: EamA family transporter RarD [Phenylobacterium sp.]|uniref:EamA family transporter RarD n=1 Tax=Phenylobacterium sp. TaxID=1871053 RepID=UPI001223477F|nr:EamA family transporter RarD [Phenylobacterium sp.]TAL29273.1 MAG: EamA family transporter RarD [Phenylobacterium sp.]